MFSSSVWVSGSLFDDVALADVDEDFEGALFWVAAAVFGVNFARRCSRAEWKGRVGRTGSLGQRVRRRL